MRTHEDSFRRARTCYDHLAGRLGVALADALQARGHVLVTAEGGLVTRSGQGVLQAFGVGLVLKAERRNKSRALCRTCLDGTEKRPHLAGRLGAALCARCFDLGWIERVQGGRALHITDVGQEGFARTFGVTPECATASFSGQRPTRGTRATGSTSRADE